MKKLYYVFTIVLLASCQNKIDETNKIKAGLQSHQKITANIELNYLLYLPDNYNSNSAERFPTILFLHGAGERGDSLDLVKTWGPPKIADEQGLPFIVISPQCPKNEYWTSMLFPLKILLDTIIENFNVDTSRIYLTGMSMGGFGTFAFANVHPEYFAAIAPICGGGTPSMLRKSKDIPTWVFHGENDKVVPLESSAIMVSELEKLGAEVKFTIYKGVDHFSWIPAYNESGLFNWFLEHKK